MVKNYLTLKLEYKANTGKFTVSGDVKKSKQKDLVEIFLREQIGAGVDNSEAHRRNTYHIELKWYPENDRIEVVDDTGRKGLRDGILYQFLGKQEKK